MSASAERGRFDVGSDVVEEGGGKQTSELVKTEPTERLDSTDSLMGRERRDIKEPRLAAAETSLPVAALPRDLFCLFTGRPFVVPVWGQKARLYMRNTRS